MPVHPPTDDDSLPDRPEEEPVPEETWQRFLDDSEGAIRTSAPKEPSARARAVARRLREQDELAARRRSAARRRRWARLRLWCWTRLRPGRRPGRPGDGARPGDGGRRSRAAAPQGPAGGGGRLRRTARMLVPPLIGIGVVLAVMNPSALAFWHHGRRTAPEPAVTLSPVPPKSSSAAATPTEAHPFAGSPAAGWADGRAGIVLPPAAAVGGLSREQVAAALERTRDYLAATELDPATLRGAWPAAAEHLVAPSSRWASDLHGMIDRPGPGHDPLSYLSRYRPAQLRLAGDTVKVRGRTTFTGADRGSVEIRTDYTFVYPFVRTGGRAGVSRGIVRQTLALRVYPVSQVPSARGLLWITDASTYDFNSACDVHDGFLHPQFDDTAPAAPAAGGHRDDPYDLRQPLKTLGTGCDTVTRT